MQSKIMKRVVSSEYLIGAVLVALFFIVIAGFQWYWLFIFFLAFDVTIFGYLINNKVGAVLYNISHSLIAPAVLIIIYIATTQNWILFIGLLWLFHICIDRALGFGLKHFKGFGHTHLGKIGKARKQS